MGKVGQPRILPVYNVFDLTETMPQTQQKLRIFFLVTSSHYFMNGDCKTFCCSSNRVITMQPTLTVSSFYAFIMNNKVLLYLYCSPFTCDGYPQLPFFSVNAQTCGITCNTISVGNMLHVVSP